MLVRSPLQLRSILAFRMDTLGIMCSADPIRSRASEDGALNITISEQYGGPHEMGTAARVSNWESRIFLRSSHGGGRKIFSSMGMNIINF